MTDMTIDGVGKRVSGDLYDADFNFGIDKLSILGEDGERIEVAEPALHRGDRCQG